MIRSPAEQAAEKFPTGTPTGAESASESDAVLDNLTATSSLLDSVKAEEDKVAHDDESVEDYMSALLKRYGVSSSEPTSANSAATSASSAEASGSKSLAGAAAVSPSSGNRSTEKKPAPNRQPAAAPEDRSGLSAMREVAMLSAQGALETHSCKRLIQAMHSKLATIAVAIVSSIALVAMTTKVGGWSYTGAIVMLLLATFWTWQYLASARELSQKSAAVRESPQRSTTNDEFRPARMS